MENKIDVPFGAKDSELNGWEYTIPENMEAEIKGGKIIVKQKESEDEMIRKRIILRLQYDLEQNLNKFTKKEIPEEIAYLEKQKIISDNLKIAGIDVRQDGSIERHTIPYLEKQKEQKPKFNVGDTIRLKNSYAEYTIESISNGRYYCKGCSIDIGDGNRDYELVRQKSAGWSEEDETHRDFILESLEDQIRFCKKDAEGAYYAKQIRTAQNWLKSLFERFNPQPNQEWSEEDKKFINDLCNLLAAIAKNSYVGSYYAPDLINKIKSLRPHPYTVDIKDATKFGNLEYERGVKDGIQSEKSRQWKPSEEQIKAIDLAIRFVTDDFDEHPTLSETLREFYNELLKNYSYEYSNNKTAL